MKKITILSLSVIFLLFANVHADARQDIFATLTPTQLFALAIYGEARGERMEGQIAVGTVILLRQSTGKWGDMKKVILSPWQFSCFNPSDIQYRPLKKIARSLSDPKYKKPKSLEEAFILARGMRDGYIKKHKKLEDNFVLHFKTAAVNPKWAKKMRKVTVIGNHEFYSELVHHAKLDNDKNKVNSPIVPNKLLPAKHYIFFREERPEIKQT